MSQTFTDESKYFGAYNRQQKNINPLLPNKFVFFLTKLPELSLATKSVNIPGVTLPHTTQSNPFNPIKRSGLNLDYEDLEVTFIVDEDMNNWHEIYYWMYNMALTHDSSQYSKIENEEIQPTGGLTSDAEVLMLNNKSVPSRVFYYHDAFPIYLSPLMLSNDTTNPEAMECTVHFAYTYYTSKIVNPTEPDPDATDLNPV